MVTINLYKNQVVVCGIDFAVLLFTKFLKREGKMKVMFSRISHWSFAAQYSNLNTNNRTTQVGQNDFKNLLGIEKNEASKESENLKEARALIKEVGFVKFARITQVVNQIQRALKRVMQATT